LKRSYLAKTLFIGALVATPFVLAGCTTTSTGSKSTQTAQGAKESGVTIRNGKKTYTYTSKDRECLERAMFFESARSSRDGLVAVGTVVMNRLVSEKYPETICGVVGQKNQFAPGVMSRAMNSKAMPDVKEAADSVLKGERHPKLKNAMFFHTAGLKFPYKNMHYVLVAGGNSFYEKRRQDGTLESPLPETPYNVAAAYEPKNGSMPDSVYDVTGAARAASGKGDRIPAAAPVMVASAEQQRMAPVPSGFPAQAAAQPVAAEAPVQVAYHVPAAPAPSHVSANVPAQLPFETKPIAASATQNAFAAGATEMDKQKVDAIGALLLKQDRPEPAF
jgi:hypothetical protein